MLVIATERLASGRMIQLSKKIDARDHFLDVSLTIIGYHEENDYDLAYFV